MPPYLYSDVPTIATGDWIDASWINTYIGDNLRALWPFTAIGDLPYALAANRLGALAKPASLGFLQNDAAGALAWKTGGNALELLRKNAANTAYEYAPIGATCIAYRATDWPLVAGQKIPFDAHLQDADAAWHSTSVNSTRITVPITGYYEVSGMIVAEGVSALRYYTGTLTILGNLLMTSRGLSESNFTVYIPFPSRRYPVSAGQYFEFEVDNTPTVLAGDAHVETYMQVQRVR